MTHSSLLVVAATLAVATLAGCDSTHSDPLAADPTEADAPPAVEPPPPEAELAAHEGPIDLAPNAPLVRAALRADAVVYGEVTAISYSQALLAGNAEGTLPLTYVTYTVIDGIRGGEPGEQLTLMFAGGPLPDGSITMPADQPLFDLGDTDVLLVADNGVNGCPLVDCADGRIRVLDDALFTDSGQAWQMDDQGQLRRGRRVEHETVRFHRIGDHVVERAPAGVAVAFAAVRDTLGVADFAAALPLERFAVAPLSADPTQPPVVQY